MKKTIACLSFLTLGFSLYAQKLIRLPVIQESWSRPFEPFRIVGNLYYVGTYDLASYLIVTPEGNILINTGLAESASLIQKNIKTLGFSMGDIKILLATHAHYDHVGAMAGIKKITGAKMMMQEADVPALLDGGNSDYVLGGKGSTFLPVKVDRSLKDKDDIALGGMHITVHNSAGHTKGAGSFTFSIQDGPKTYHVLIANMPTILDDVKLSGMPGYSQVGKDYAATFDRLKKIPVDIFLSSHASQFDLHEKYKPGNAYDPERFVDHGEFLKKINELEAIYKTRLAKEMNAKQTR